ncbi:MAG: hypothetical protein F6K28_36655, partial [Microcoleus sp. SIO2G3]|nr:hypothetical protein [Microcoleus sp. SIO2G3]
MKGDFTRFTFQPQKHYSSVLMQQGRLQLDADWNEQMSILNHLNQLQVRDIIGSVAGTSQTEGGYQILPVYEVQSSAGKIQAIDGSPSKIKITDTTAEILKDSAITIDSKTRLILSVESDSKGVPQLTLDLPFDSLPDADIVTSFQYQKLITDLRITEGRFYIDGVLCELNEGTLLPVERRSANQVQTPVVLLDGQVLKADQWVEIKIEQEKDTSLKLNKITEVNPKDFTIDLQEAIDDPEAEASIKLRRLTTYKTQADFTKTADSFLPDALYLVYLDVWQRHVTALDDRSLQEVALNGLDTATRLQTIAQVKLLDINKDLESAQVKQSLDFDSEGRLFRKKPSVSALDALPSWQALSNRSVSMTATTALDPDSAIDTSGSYQGGDNRLYRVEIHQGGTIDEATFKWSRDNGSIVSAIDRIEGNVVRLKGSIQDEYDLFGSPPDSSQSQKNPWVEIITEAQELNNEPGILVQVQAVKPPNLILLDLSQVQGTSLPEVKKETAEQEKYKIRRWDGQSGTNSSWQLLERGIQIQFSVGESQFKTGDYWLISARANQPIDWPRDLPQPKQQLGKPIAQSPAGIQHRYGILAVVKTEKMNDVTAFFSAVSNNLAWEKADLRTQFIPLLNRGISSGIDSQEARLHVQGDSEQTATGKIEAIATDPP